MKFTMEQRIAMAIAVTEEQQQLDKLINTYVEDYGTTRETGITLISTNFFSSYNETSIRNEEGFKRYYLELDTEERNKLRSLFKCMKENIQFEIIDERTVSIIGFQLHEDPWDKPYYFELPWNDSLFHFINSYRFKLLNVQVSVDELLIHIMEKEPFQ